MTKIWRRALEKYSNKDQSICCQVRKNKDFFLDRCLIFLISFIKFKGWINILTKKNRIPYNDFDTEKVKISSHIGTDATCGLVCDSSLSWISVFRGEIISAPSTCGRGVFEARFHISLFDQFLGVFLSILSGKFITRAFSRRWDNLKIYTWLLFDSQSHVGWGFLCRLSTIICQTLFVCLAAAHLNVVGINYKFSLTDFT